MAFGKFRTDEESKTPKGPSMQRSKNQLATAYAPGAFFTFEGGMGSCISLPDNSARVDEADITDATKIQILLRLKEIWQSWFERAMASGNDEHPTDPRQCVEGALVPDGNRLTPLPADRIAFVNPLRMTFAPAPLTFVCNRCHAFRRFETVKDSVAGPDALAKARCPNSTGGQSPCQWRQLDVIFVHWSGEWQGARPSRYEWDSKFQQAAIRPDECALCGCREFRLDTSSPRIGSWRFYCANNSQHQVGTQWIQHDEFTTGIVKDSTKRLAERRMEAISYRASSAFYAHTEQFILFSSEDQKLLALLEPGHREELGDEIARIYRYGGAELTVAEMRDKLLAAGHGGEWDSYANLEKMRNTMKAAGDADMVATLDRELCKLIARWKGAGQLPQTGEVPRAVKDQLAARANGDYPARFDPFVLAIEHEALSRSKLQAHAFGGRSAYVRFNHLDRDLAPKDAEAKQRQEARTGELMTRLGLADLGLVREFELCRFTHGYTRVSATPTVVRHNLTLPVRLRLFEPTADRRRPVYVVTQGNEAIYARLEPIAVFRWLEALEVTDLPAWDPKEPVLLGGKVLETAHSFGRFFSKLTEDSASTYRYVYTLLHSYAHVLMKNIAELSGLDLGSLGEYIFPTDLAFVVYRNGTTMDLGNLSALWRNEENRFLARLLKQETHRCNSGSLCDAGGGACPDCIMIPETSCVASNRLLSRAVINGGPAPREDLTHKGKRIMGYLESINAAAKP